MADGLPTGKTWLRGSETLPSPSCTQGPCKSRSVRKISCMLDGDVVRLSYNRKVSQSCQSLASVVESPGSDCIGWPLQEVQRLHGSLHTAK